MGRSAINQVEITVGNSISHIKGLTTAPFAKLRSVLSYDIDTGYYQSAYPPRKKYLIGTRGDFPTGVLPRVRQFLKDNNIAVKICDSRQPPKRLNKLHPTFVGEHYKDQVLAANATALAGRGCVSMPTGSGKSRVMMMIIANFDVKTLVVVPTLELKRQLTAECESVFGKAAKYVTIENIDSKALNSPQDYGCLIIDEAHHVAAATYQRLNRTVWNNIYYRVFLTATPFRNNPNETLLFEGIAGKLIYKLSYITAIKKGYIVPVEAYYINLPKQKTDAYGWHEVYSELVTNNVSRNDIIAKLALYLDQGDKSTLLLVKEVNHGKRLADLTCFPFAHGVAEDSQELIASFNDGNKFMKTLIGTEGILGEGVDTRPCEYVIIAGLGKAKSAFMQKIGRAVRRYPGKESAKIILFRDTSHKYLLKHFREQCKILKDEYNVVPIELELGDT